MADPYFANVSLLVANGATTFDDDSPYGHTVSAVGTAAMSTDQSRWSGGSSIYLSGSGNNYLTIPSHAAFDLDTDDFTIEYQCYAVSGGHGGAYPSMVQIGTDGIAGTLYVLANGNTAPLRVSVQISRTNGTYTYVSTSTVVASLAWKHIAVTRQSGVWKTWIEGALDQTETVASFDVIQNAVHIGIGYDGNGFKGYIQAVRVTKGIARYTSAFTAPTDPFETAGPQGQLSCPSPMGSVNVIGNVWVRPDGMVSVGTPLGAPSLKVVHDFTVLVDAAASTIYTAYLLTPGSAVRVPISSWQATLRTDEAQYAQAVIPACTSWLDALAVATEFVVYRRSVLSNGAMIEYEMVRCPIEQLNIYRGSRNHTATVTGYTASPYVADNDPPTVHDRTMTGLRTVSSSSGLRRARCAVDWLLRPGHRAYVDGEELLVDWINYYVGNGDEYMDIGESA